MIAKYIIYNYINFKISIIKNWPRFLIFIYIILIIFSVHVRRTDKIGSEAAFHDLKEYMNHVDSFYDLYEKNHPNSIERNVYLASDEVSVLLEAKSK